LSAANFVLSHSTFGVVADVSWLPLGGTGLAPPTVNPTVALAGGDALAGEDPGAGETDEADETGGDPVADEVAEHDTDSAVITHRHAAEPIRLFADFIGLPRSSGMAGGQPRLRPPMFSDPSLADRVPSSAWVT
jgi:hypothetical protein